MPKKRVSSVKTGHWETEKAETRLYRSFPYENSDMAQSQKTCFGGEAHLRIILSVQLLFPYSARLQPFFSKTVCKGFFGVPFYADMGITAVSSFLRKLAAAVFVLTDG